MKKIFVLIILSALLFLVSQQTAQTSENQTDEITSMGELNSWRIHSSGNAIRDMASGGGRVWAATSGGAVSWDLAGTNYQKYTVKDGLPDNNILAMTIDGNGNKWFGTRGGGVAHFDGEEWTIYTEADGLAENYIMMGMAASGANVWVTTEGSGISRFDGNQWHIYTEADGLISNYTRDVAIDKLGNVWVGTGSGVSKFNGTSWTNYTTDDGLAHNVINGIAVDNNNNIWFCTWGGVTKFDGSWRTYLEVDGLASDFCVDIYADHEVWAGSNSGVSRLSKGIWSSYTTADGLADNNIYALTRAQSGAMWIGTWYDGISIESISEAESIQWSTHITDDALLDNNINSILIDKQHNKWFATNRGLSHFDGIQWHAYTQADGLPSYGVRDLAQDAAGNLWLATGGAATMFDGQTFHTYDNPDLPNDNYTSVATGGGAIWFGTIMDGVASLSTVGWKMYTESDGLASNQVRAIAVDHNNTVWVGTEHGLSIFDGESWSIYDGLMSNSVNRILVDDSGIVWVLGSGVSKIGNGGITAIGLADRSVYDVAFDHLGDPWFATNKGVSHFDGSTWTHYTPADGIASNNALSIAIEGPWRVWVGTWGGITEFYNGMYIPMVIK